MLHPPQQLRRISIRMIDEQQSSPPQPLPPPKNPPSPEPPPQKRRRRMIIRQLLPPKPVLHSLHPQPVPQFAAAKSLML